MHRVSKLLVGLGMTLMIAVPSVAAASEETARTRSDTRGLVATQSAGTFDWLAKPVMTQATFKRGGDRVQRQIGHGSWICSPAGFGRGSRCYSN